MRSLPEAFVAYHVPAVYQSEQKQKDKCMSYTKYRASTYQWRWRFVINGRIIAVSSESYINEADCDRSIAIMKTSGNTPVYRE